MDEAPLDPVRCAGHCGGHIALLDMQLGDRVGAQIGVHQRGPFGQRGRCIGQRLQRLERRLDQLQRVLGPVAVPGDNHRVGLADIAHLVVGENALGRQRDPVADPLGPALGRVNLHAADRGEVLGEIRTGQGEHDTLGRRRRRHIDRGDRCMGVLAAREGDLDHLGQDHVGDIATLAEQQAPVLPPGHRMSDIAVWRLAHCPSFRPAWVIWVLAYSAIACTIPS